VHEARLAEPQPDQDADGCSLVDYPGPGQGTLSPANRRNARGRHRLAPKALGDDQTPVPDSALLRPVRRARAGAVSRRLRGAAPERDQPALRRGALRASGDRHHALLVDRLRAGRRANRATDQPVSRIGSDSLPLWTFGARLSRGRPIWSRGARALVTDP